ncbi:hypothetical protein BDV26DRAFT_298632 [Aspergillus bertholletiae]|uniref:BTB domain-containing protein n=1 Tax=Aspergillus bertholletiae TaxID=1226010 RepID=A0A5N7AS79_9EURO|nr:hypothetical protein BDV26DRAFT_298632 [Aspergillus bertholletiae]
MAIKAKRPKTTSSQYTQEGYSDEPTVQPVDEYPEESTAEPLPESVVEYYPDEPTVQLVEEYPEESTAEPLPESVVEYYPDEPTVQLVEEYPEEFTAEPLPESVVEYYPDEPTVQLVEEYLKKPIAEPDPISDPEITEYSQPEDCPYEGCAVTILIGPRQKQYTIPQALLNKFPTLQNTSQSTEPSSSRIFGSYKNNQPSAIRLPDVDEDIGHTLMHYLYTGDFQTLKAPSKCDMSKRTKEYTRSVLTYRTALAYGLKPLEDHAKRYMEIFDPHIQIFDIIRLARRDFPKISDNQWYSDYLSARILAAFDTNEDIFLSEQYFKGFGGTPEFDTFLGKTIALAYSSKISAIRSGAMFNVAVAGPVLPREVDLTVQNGQVLAGGNGDLKLPEQQRLSPEPELNHGQGEGAIRRGTDISIKTESDGYCRPGFENGSQIYVTEDLQSSRINVATPDSDFGENSALEQALPRAEPGLGGYKCPNWQTHLLDEKLYRDCKACRSRILQMFVGLVP